MRAQSLSALSLGLFIAPFLAGPGSAQSAPSAFITIGSGNLSTGMFNGTDEVPFLDAIAALKDTSGFALGGQIEVLAGEYEFENPVLVDIPGVTIRGSRGAVIRRKAGTRLFTFNADARDGRIDGIQLVDEEAVNNGILISVQAANFTLTNARILVETTGSPVTGYSAVRLAPAVTNGARYGALIEGNEFTFGADSRGIVGLRSQGGFGLRVIGNRFALRPDLAEPPAFALIGAAMVLRNEELSTVSANVFHGLKATLTEGPENAIVAFINEKIGTNDPEAHHLCLTGNYFEALAGWAIVNLAGGKFCSITGNAFGRVSGTDGVIRLGLPLGESQRTGSDNVISGNQFHNATTGVDQNNPRTVIYVVDQSTPSIGHNQFTMGTKSQIVLEDTYGASVTGNQFVAAQGSAGVNIGPAILFDGALKPFVNANVASRHEQGGRCWSAMTGGTSTNAQVANNHVFDPCTP